MVHKKSYLSTFEKSIINRSRRRQEYLLRESMNPLQKSIKKYRFVSVDTETTGRNNDFYMCGVLDYNDEYHVFYDKDEAINFIRRLKHNDLLVVATNLGFDYSVLAKDTRLVNICEFITSNGRFIRVRLKGTYNNIDMIDTLNFGGLSVEKMGLVIGSQKLGKPRFLGNKPRNKKERLLLESYNKQDCFVSKKFMELIQDGLNVLGGELKITISSSALDLFKRKYLKESLLREEKSTGLLIKKNIHNAYFGGRTEVFRRGLIKDYYFYDVNSLYPSQMLKDYPNPNSVKYYPDSDISLLRYPGVSFFSLFVPHHDYPLLPYKLGGKLIFPVGTFSGYYTHLEINEALKYGVKVLSMKESIIYTESKPYFKGYVEELYALRKEYKKDGNPLELVFKLLLNSLYGRFAMKKNDSTVFFDGESDEEVLSILGSPGRKVYMNDFFNSYYVEKKDYDGNSSFPIWSCYITSYARIHLHRLILESEPVYVDTDSVITKKKMAESTDLGGLKLEKYVFEGLIIKPKMYFVNEEVKVKGVPTPRSGTGKFRLKKNIISGSVIRYEKFVKPKEAIRRCLVVNSKFVVEKHINLEDDKRVWSKKFDPLILEESSPLVVRE